MVSRTPAAAGAGLGTAGTYATAVEPYIELGTPTGCA
jgi:hypothetical protein